MQFRLEPQIISRYLKIFNVCGFEAGLMLQCLAILELVGTLGCHALDGDSRQGRTTKASCSSGSIVLVYLQLSKNGGGVCANARPPPGLGLAEGRVASYSFPSTLIAAS